MLSDVLDAAAIGEEHRRGRALADWSLDDGSGTVARDAAGGGRDGTLVGFDAGSPWVAGRVGGALDFDGVDAYLDCAAPGGLATTQGTIELWFDADTLDDNRDLVNVFEDGWENFLLLRRTAEGRILLLIEDDDAALASVTSNEVVGAGWHHVAVTQDGTGLAIYVDGRQQVTGGANSSAWTGHLTLTGTWLGGGHWSYFDGRLDEVRIWARALTPDEITAHAAVP
jgi:hypothetical protein